MSLEKKKPAMNVVQRYAWQHAATLTDEKYIRAALAWFVAETRAGRSVNAGVMSFIADGVQRHLEGKKPWPAKRGNKARPITDAIEDAFPMYEYFTRIMLDAAMRGESTTRNGIGVDVLPLGPEQAISETAEHFEVHDETVKRAIRLVNESRSTEGALISALTAFFGWVQHAEDGRQWLESAEGKKWQMQTKYIATLPHEKISN